MPWQSKYRDIEAERKKRADYQKKFRASGAYAKAQAKYRASAKGKHAAARNLRGNQLRRYGLTHEAYESMLVAQNRVCAICHKPNIEGYALSVDHDHKTGKVRALLCVKCNMALGGVNDDVDLLSEMIGYLMRHGA